jgi:hypothetical protein
MGFTPGEDYDRNGGHTLVVPDVLLPYLTDSLFDRLVREEPLD